MSLISSGSISLDSTFKVKKENQNKIKVIYYQIKTFPYTFREKKMELFPTVFNFFYQFGTCFFAPSRVSPFRLKKFFASKRIVSEQRSVSHEIRLFTSSIRFPFFRFFRLFSLQIFRNYSL
jgi:hypothetical protein